MLVYGDAGFAADLGGLWRSLARLAADAGRGELEAARTLLVAAGEVEQAVHDELDAAGPSSRHPAVAHAHALTAFAGRALLAAAAGRPPPGKPPLEGLVARGNVRVRIPEGFAHYGLFPESYFDSARRWLDDARPSGPVVVLGVRSIGTALAACVAAFLDAAGLAVTCHSVRPTGHPFDRHLDLTGWPLPRRAHVLVVDEGPGLSGSSLAATVRAVHAAGLEPARVALLPGHAGEPGPRAPAWVREVWSSTPRHPAAQDSRVLERGLAEVVAAAAPLALPYPPGVGPAAVARPPVPSPCARFARPLLLVTSGGLVGGCKLAGLAVTLDAASGELRTYADVVADGLRRRAAAGLGPPVLGVRDGFVVLPWVAASDGGLPAPSEAELSAYLGATAGAPMSAGDEADAAARLVALLEANTAGLVAERELAAAREALSRPLGLPAATDYDLGGHHWLGRWKVGGRGAALPDHTAVGVQSVLWSWASAVVELGVRPALPRADLGPALRASVIAYAAFRRGLAELCGDTCGDPRERARAAADAGRYEEVLRRRDVEPLAS